MISLVLWFDQSICLSMCVWRGKYVDKHRSLAFSFCWSRMLAFALMAYLRIRNFREWRSLYIMAHTIELSVLCLEVLWPKWWCELPSVLHYDWNQEISRKEVTWQQLGNRRSSSWRELYNTHVVALTCGEGRSGADEANCWKSCRLRNAFWQI